MYKQTKLYENLGNLRFSIALELNSELQFLILMAIIQLATVKQVSAQPSTYKYHNSIAKYHCHQIPL